MQRYELWHHEPIFNSSEAHELSQGLPAIDLKSLALLDRSDTLYVVTLDASSRLSLARLRTYLNTGKLRFADENRIAADLEVGLSALAPFGYPKEIRCLVDANLHQLEDDFLISPGINDATMRLSPQQFWSIATLFRCEEGTFTDQ